MNLIKMSLIMVIPLVAAASGLEEIFQNPPHEAKPRGYWLWPHGNFDYAAIRHELQEFKAKGLGGVDIFDLGVSDRGGVIPPSPEFLSPEQVDGIAFALEEAKKLGLKIGLIVSSSWNAGATWTTPEQALMNLVAWADTVDGPAAYERDLPFPELPASFSKSYGEFSLHVPKDENGMPEYYKDVAVLVFPLRKDGTLASSDRVEILNETKPLKFDIPEGRWIILRAVCTNFGQRLWAPSYKSQGLIIDHFSKEATRNHFQTVIDRLEQRCGPLSETALERLYLASYESNVNVIWTPSFAEEFLKRNNYRIESWLPALFSTTIQDEKTTERFLYDYKKTASDLFIENFYRTARDICHDHGLLICSEAGGPGPPLHEVPTEDLKALGSVDIMRGEFWVDKKDRLNPDGFEQLQIVKGIASAAHIYNHKIVEMEAFTSHINWQEGPATFKPLADRAFCEGMNRVVYHTMSHNVPEAGLPGWSYSAGTHISTNLTWWDMSDQLHSYLTRCSALLQEGHFVADACFYYGHDIPNFTKTKHIRPTLGPGYDYDDINTEVLLTADVQEDRLVLPGGMSYAVLVLPDEERMDLVVLQKIGELIKSGATVVGPKPKRIYGLAGYREQEMELLKLADELWGTDEVSSLDRKIGNGRLVAGKNVREILLDKAITPDVEFYGAPSSSSLDFIHHRTGDEDIYFVRNAESTEVAVDVRFRVKNRQPEFWDPVTGEMRECALFAPEDDGIRLPLHLGQHGSVFVIFTKKPPLRHITAVGLNGTRCFPVTKSSPSVGIQAVEENGWITFSATRAGDYELVLSDGDRKKIQIESSDEFPIDGPWDVRFPYGWGAATIQTFDSLYSWTSSGDEGTSAFSGTATYRKSFRIPQSFLNENRKYILDLGEVREVARVYLNGYEAGISGFAPHRIDVTAELRPGDNYLVVKVANTWLNRLIADDRLPVEKRLTHTNLTRGPTGDTAWREATPLVSGLLGPVRIIAERHYPIAIE